MSLDGYIADRDGGADWLAGQEERNRDAGELDTYPEFIKGIDTVIMGWNTYHQAAAELSPDRWVYPEQISYVVTHRKIPSTEQIILPTRIRTAS